MLVGDPNGKSVFAPSAVAESPEVIDQMLDAGQLRDQNAVANLLRMNNSVWLNNAIVAKVVGFASTPKHGLACAELDPSNPAFPKKRVWCLLAEEPRSEATTEGVS